MPPAGLLSEDIVLNYFRATMPVCRTTMPGEQQMQSITVAMPAYNEAENVVRRAFHEDTKDRNSLDNCMLVGINWIRKLVKEN